MDFIQIKETCIYICDLERTESFYRDKLGLKVIGKVEGRHVFFQAGNSVLLCFIPEKTMEASHELPSHGASGSVHFAFEVKQEDYSDAKTEIQQQEISIEHEQEWKNGLHSFYFRDPDNNLVEIIQSGIWK